MIKLAICTPVDGDSVTGQVSVGYATSLARVLRDTRAELVSTQITYSYDICRARNRIVSFVLRELPDTTHVLWWDSDVVPNDLSVIRGMLETGHDVVACPYLRKRHPLMWTHVQGNVDCVNGPCREVDAIPFGFAITSIGCLRKMTEFYRSEMGYIDVRDGAPSEPCVGLFNLAWRYMGPGRELLSEDYSFSLRWRQIGGRVWVYQGAGSDQLAHVGNFAWRADRG